MLVDLVDSRPKALPAAGLALPGHSQAVQPIPNARIAVQAIIARRVPKLQSLAQSAHPGNQGVETQGTIVLLVRWVPLATQQVPQRASTVRRGTAAYRNQHRKKSKGYQPNSMENQAMFKKRPPRPRKAPTKARRKNQEPLAQQCI